MTDPTPKRSLFALSPLDVKTLMLEWGERPYRATQMLDWFFKKREFSIAKWSNMPAPLREKLTEHFDDTMPEIVSQLDSPDGATKLLLRSGKQQLIEAVILRYDNRVALCVSSQVGCKLACSFCQTGKLGFFRHLEAGEIMSQFCLAETIVRQEGRSISNIVFMGMGEPLDNFEPVVTTVNNLIHPEGFGLSHRRVTVSTSGIAPKIIELSQRTRTALAISLHACRDDLRNELMPINRRYPLAELKSAIQVYQRVSQTKITFEYILIQGKNTSVQEAKELVRFVEGIPCKINLIPFNHHPGIPYERPEVEEIETFQKYLLDRGHIATVRYSKGGEVSAACGQLAAKKREQLQATPVRKAVVA
jgi:23S rRNA (adenine2503-C2)-methyltransferase